MQAETFREAVFAYGAEKRHTDDAATFDRDRWLLPDPVRRDRQFTIISVDDHAIEPPDMFEGRLPQRFSDRAPRVIETDQGGQAWLFEDYVEPSIGLSAAAGRRLEDCAWDPSRFELMRPGCYDADARVRDMDLDGVYASVCFPSALVGFGGQKLQLGVEPDFALALVRAVNDWHLDDWAGRHPDRLIPVQIPYLRDIEVAAAEIRANAARGFKAVSFPEAPHKLGLPSLHTGAWDPFFRACEETGTVICLHIGSSSDAPITAPDAPIDTTSILFFGYAMFTAVDWLYSKVPLRFPNLKIAMSEGGIAWVPGLIDRLKHVRRYRDVIGTWTSAEAISPEEALHRNFWFCLLDDAATLKLRDDIGVDRIMIEVDYPHLDSCWPDSQSHFARHLTDLSSEEIADITWRNASHLFSHSVPAAVVDNPNHF